MSTTVVEKSSFSKLKIEKVKFFTQSPTKVFCISVINVGGCLANCLTFRPFLTLDPQQHGCLYKKTCTYLNQHATLEISNKRKPNMRNIRLF